MTDETSPDRFDGDAGAPLDHPDRQIAKEDLAGIRWRAKIVSEWSHLPGVNRDVQGLPAQVARDALWLADELERLHGEAAENAEIAARVAETRAARNESFVELDEAMQQLGFDPHEAERESREGGA